MAAQSRSAGPTSTATRPATPRRRGRRARAPSTSNCCTMRHRPAPIDRRMAISRWRADARASSSPARLAQVISRTTPATAIRISSTGRSTAMPPSGELSSGNDGRAMIDVALLARQRRAHAVEDRVELGAHLLARRSRRQPRDQREPAAAAGLEAIAARHHDRLRADRQPHVVAESRDRAEEARRRPRRRS